MKKYLIILAAAVAVPAHADNTFVAVLNSGQEIQTPKVDSNALGNALLTLTSSTRMLCYSISFTELVGIENVAHFHGPASAGQNANILFDISPAPSPTGSPKTGCVGPLGAKRMSQLKRGLFYINVHSDLFPSGEIRGQVLQSVRAVTRGQVAE